MSSQKVMSAAALGTTAMTLFSYLVSQSKEKNYREPEVLAQLINRLVPGLDKQQARGAGWAAHYATGVAFASIFDELWRSGKMKPNFFSGLLLGAISGVAGILAWKFSFRSHPNPPIKDMKSYLGHLMLAHLVFGTFTAAGYRASDYIFKNGFTYSLN